MLDRALAEKVKKLSTVRKVVLVTGARQVGKTTMLKMVKDSSRNYIFFDDLNIRKLAQDAPKLFMMNYKPPIIIDEIQYAPNCCLI